MAQSQYNFKVEDGLKEEAETLSQDFQSKQEFLAALLESYKTIKSNKADTDIDLSKYEDIDTKTKLILNDTFKHIIYTLQQNTSSTKQQLMTVEAELKAIAEERESFKEQIETLKANFNQEALDSQKLHKLEIEAKDIQITKNEDLQKQQLKQLTDTELKIKDIQTESEQIKLIAKQVEVVTNENSILRKEINEINIVSQLKADETASKIKELIESLTEKEKEAYRANIEFKNIEKSVETLKSELEKTKSESKAKNVEIKNIEKENIILSTKLELLEPKEKNKD